MKISYNLDISPKKEWISQFPDIACLLDLNPIRARFENHETDAERYKKRYWFWTWLSLLLIATSVLSGVAIAVFFSILENASTLATLGAFLGVTGIVIELILIINKVKEKWLLNRYAAERLRSIIGASFSLGACRDTRKDLPEALSDYCGKVLAGLDSDLNKGVAAFRNFRPADSIYIPSERNTSDRHIITQCSEAYEFFRVEYQKRFIEGEIAKLENSSRLQNSFSDVIFISGVLLAVVGLMSFGYGVHASKVLAFLSMLMFVTSSILGMVGQGAFSRPHIQRYQKYLDDIHSLGKPSKSARVFTKRIAEMEMFALRELDVFCQQIDSISLRI